MNCHDIESLILAERDGGLTDKQLAILSDHVAACPACHQLRTRLAAAIEIYQDDLAGVPAPDADEAWRTLQGRLHQPARKASRAPIVWFGAPLAAAAAIAIAFFVERPVPSEIPVDAATAAIPLHDPSIIAGADFVEAGDPNASTIVYVDKESGWLVVWAAAADIDTRG